MRWFSRRRRESAVATDRSYSKSEGRTSPLKNVISNHQANEIQLNRTRFVPGTEQERPLDTTTGVLMVVVPYTTPELTRAALRHAGVCTDLNLNVSLRVASTCVFSAALA